MRVKVKIRVRVRGGEEEVNKLNKHKILNELRWENENRINLINSKYSINSVGRNEKN